jgi:hypothetical protein
MPRYTAAFAAAFVYCGVVRYKEHRALLKKDNLLEISKDKLYNLQRKEGISTLTRQEELEYIL